jgi:hypothetical protein
MRGRVTEPKSTCGSRRDPGVKGFELRTALLLLVRPRERSQPSTRGVLSCSRRASLRRVLLIGGRAPIRNVLTGHSELRAHGERRS